MSAIGADGLVGGAARFRRMLFRAWEVRLSLGEQNLRASAQCSPGIDE